MPLIGFFFECYWFIVLGIPTLNPCPNTTFAYPLEALKHIIEIMDEPEKRALTLGTSLIWLNQSWRFSFRCLNLYKCWKRFCRQCNFRLQYFLNSFQCNGPKTIDVIYSLKNILEDDFDTKINTTTRHWLRLRPLSQKRRENLKWLCFEDGCDINLKHCATHATEFALSVIKFIVNYR